jgi:hypothetical protein
VALNLNSLPEKEYFTFDELAARWHCELSTVDQFIGQNILRPTAIIKELPIAGLIINVENLDKENFFYMSSVFNIVDGALAFNDQEQDILPIQGEYEVNEISALKVVSKDQVLVKEELEQYRCLYFSPDYYQTLLTFGGEKVLCVESVDHDRGNNTLSNVTMGRLNRKYFNYITKLERNRFEKEYGITSDTTDIKKEVSAKTQNMYINIIATFSQALLGEEYSDKPHSNASKIEMLLGSKGIALPCTAEILAKYLKKQQ